MKGLGRNKLAQLPVERRELRDAIGADSVDAELVQGFPLIDVVGGPRNHPSIERMDACNQLFINEADLLPKILRTGCDERSDWIDLPCDFEHSRWNRRKNTFDRFDNPMVERVYCAARA